MKILPLASLLFLGLGACSSPPYSNPRYIRPETEPGREGIRAAIAKKKDSFRACYEQLIQSKPKAAGKMLADFRIAATGEVTDVAWSQDDVQDPAFKQCLTTVVSGIQFAPSPEVQTVKYPFVFSNNP